MFEHQFLEAKPGHYCRRDDEEVLTHVERQISVCDTVDQRIHRQ
jgi:hypothetical protein